MAVQLSVAVAIPVWSADIAVPQFKVIAAGAVKAGASLSVTETLNWQVAEPLVLVAVTVTVVIPVEKKLPDTLE